MHTSFRTGEQEVAGEGDGPGRKRIIITYMFVFVAIFTFTASSIFIRWYAEVIVRYSSYLIRLFRSSLVCSMQGCSRLGH